MSEIQLYLDQRNPAFDSIAETLQVTDPPAKVIADVECWPWHPIKPEQIDFNGSIGFVDGVQRLEGRVHGIQEETMFVGILASYGAGAACVNAANPYQHLVVRRSFIVSNGARPDHIRIPTDGGILEYLPATVSGTDMSALTHELNNQRAAAELEVITALVDERYTLVVADGRLPRLPTGPVVGFVKTLHELYVTGKDEVSCIQALRAHERTPLFVIERPERQVYSWFLGLVDRSRLSPPLSHVARLELASQDLNTARAVADLCTYLLPRFASTPIEDARAPQNLLPVGQLERELGQLRGDLNLIRSLLADVVWQKGGSWTATKLGM